MIVDAFGYRVPACSYSGTASAPRAAGGGCATSWAPVGRGHKRMSPGVAVPGRLRQGSATVQDLTSPIAPNCQFPLSISCAASASKRIDTLLPAFAAGMRIHPAQPRRWETVHYAPLACTKRRYRPRNPLSFPDRGFAAQAWRHGISRSCHLVPLATSW